MKQMLIIAVLLMCNPLAYSNKWYLEEDWNLQEYYRYKKLYEEMAQKKAGNKLLDDDVERLYDVVKYDLKLDWSKILLVPAADSINPENRYWDGEASMKIVSKSNDLNEIELDAIGLNIKQIFINGVIIDDTPQVVEDLLTIPLPGKLPVGDTVTLDIQYTYQNSTNIGFNLYYKGQEINAASNLFVEEQIAYTVNSPTYARYWLPCNDRPSDKVVASMAVSVPDGFTVASNGLLDSVTSKGSEDGKVVKTYCWSDKAPIATYLIHATASVFKEYSEYFKSPNIEDSIEIKYYVWDKDYDGNAFNAKLKLEKTAKMLEYYSTIYSDYPFCKYGQVSVYPFIYSAMENQTMTSVHRSLLQKAAKSESVIAHEIAHQWLGDLVSATDWYNIWFKEGGATWSEALWAEYASGDTEKYYSFMLDEATPYFESKTLFTKPIYGNPSSVIFTNPYVLLTYNKSSWIYHQLQMLLGDSLNLQILGSFFKDRAFGNTNAQDFIAYYKAKTADIDLEVDLDTFFDQWLFKAGHPLYEVNADVTAKEDGKYEAHIILTQTQDTVNVPEVFKTPIYFMFFDGKKIVHRVRAFNDQKTQEYTIENLPPFDRVLVDNTRTLCRNISTKTQSIEDGTEQGFAVYPSPALNENFIYVNHSNATHIDIKLFDMMGRAIQTPIVNLTDKSQISISHIESGIYFVSINGTLLKTSIIK